MQRRIAGFHQDEEAHWVAELACGHQQHVRHDPPWTMRPWTQTAQGRQGALGQALPCRKCDTGAPLDFSPAVSAALRDALLALQRRDLTLRDELRAEGSLFEGYHPRMEAVHRDNAQQLQALIEEGGWPNERLAGTDGAEAAWRVAQHAIGEPAFMRRCRALLQHEAASGGVPPWQHAYLDDRIRVSEGRPQRYGTQFELTPAGPQVCEVEDPPHLDQRRQQAGLEPMAERLQRLHGEPRPTAAEFEARKAAEHAWRLKTGWLPAPAA